MITEEIRAALRRRYPAQECALMFEVGNATGVSVGRHADAVMMNLWPSRGLSIEGFEIKVSRSDLKRELANPAKAEEMAQFCNRWWLVTPDILKVEPGEVPDTWGHMVVLADGSSKVRIEATFKQRPAELPRGFVAAMCRASQKVGEAANSKAIRDEVERRVEAEREYILSSQVRRADIGARVAALLEKAMPNDDFRWLDEKGIAEAFGVVHRLRGNSFGESVARLARCVQTAAADASAAVQNVRSLCDLLELEMPKPEPGALPRIKRRRAA